MDWCRKASMGWGYNFQWCLNFTMIKNKLKEVNENYFCPTSRLKNTPQSWTVKQLTNNFHSQASIHSLKPFSMQNISQQRKLQSCWEAIYEAAAGDSFGLLSYDSSRLVNSPGFSGNNAIIKWKLIFTRGYVINSRMGPSCMWAQRLNSFYRLHEYF